MKHLLLILLLGISCRSKPHSNIQVQLPLDVFIEASNTSLRHVNGIWMLGKVKYNGYIIEKDSSVLLATLPVIDGRENGTAYGWFKNRKRKYERRFLNGNREGVQRGWYSNGTLAFDYFFHDDKFEGPQRTFFESGHIWQSLNYSNGYEEGKQKSYNDSGRVINNFTMKNKKLYGVIGRYDCTSISKK